MLGTCSVVVGAHAPLHLPQPSVRGTGRVVARRPSAGGQGAGTDASLRPPAGLAPAHARRLRGVERGAAAQRGVADAVEPHRPPKQLDPSLHRGAFVARCTSRDRDSAAGIAYGFRVFVDHRLAGKINLDGVLRGGDAERHRRLLDRTAPGRAGLIAESVVVVAAFAFEGLDLHRLEICIVPRNHDSRRVIEKLGHPRGRHRSSLPGDQRRLEGPRPLQVHRRGVARAPPSAHRGLALIRRNGHVQDDRSVGEPSDDRHPFGPGRDVGRRDADVEPGHQQPVALVPTDDVIALLGRRTMLDELVTEVDEDLLRRSLSTMSAAQPWRRNRPDSMVVSSITTRRSPAGSTASSSPVGSRSTTRATAPLPAWIQPPESVGTKNGHVVGARLVRLLGHHGPGTSTCRRSQARGSPRRSRCRSPATRT